MLSLVHGHHEFLANKFGCRTYISVRVEVGNMIELQYDSAKYPKLH